MKKLLHFLVTNIAIHPDDVKVDVVETDETITATVTVNGEDMGKIIGKEGKTINAIRSLAKVIAIKEKKKFTLNLTS